MNEDVVFLPIFDQAAPGIWDSFLSICDAATSYSCGYSMCVNDFQSVRKELERAWKRRSFNFAFGAYDGGSMVGFINGDCVGRVATIRGLYVLPEYMGQKIGGRLLKLAERASTFGASSLDLISLSKAQKFYERYGYKPIFRGSNHYTKSITRDIRIKNLVVPVFTVTKAIKKSCTNILNKYNCDFDTGIVNTDHIPMFVYVDSLSEIAGFIIDQNSGAKGSEILYVSPDQPTKLISSFLNKELNVVKCFNRVKKSHSR